MDLSSKCEFWLLGFLQITNAFLDFTIIDAKELIGSSGHINQIWFTFRPFFIKEVINRVAFRLCLQEA